MDAWVTVVVAGIVALSTLGATFLQNWHSNKRFKIEIGRAIDVGDRKRKWEVRSEPLLKLRNELALMAFMQNRINDLAEKQHTGYDEAKEKEKVTEELYKAIEEWEAYLAKGNLIQTLFIQYDSELFNKVHEIQESYIVRYHKLFNEAETEEAIKSLGKTWPKVIEAQELINKRLEEL